jgi:chemotaxis protein CheD
MLPEHGNFQCDNIASVLASRNARYGVHAMELLINAMLQLGAARDGLRASVFGGANVLAIKSTVGQLNAQFALNYLKREKLSIVRRDIGGEQARWVYLDPKTQVIEVRTLQNAAKAISSTERNYAQSLLGSEHTRPDVSLFAETCP